MNKRDDVVGLLLIEALLAIIGVLVFLLLSSLPKRPAAPPAPPPPPARHDGNQNEYFNVQKPYCPSLADAPWLYVPNN